jgi:hypothetical protein
LKFVTGSPFFVLSLSPSPDTVRISPISAAHFALDALERHSEALKGVADACGIATSL